MVQNEGNGVVTKLPTWVTSTFTLSGSAGAQSDVTVKVTLSPALTDAELTETLTLGGWSLSVTEALAEPGLPTV